jgi:outer membrane protein TolC
MHALDSLMDLIDAEEALLREKLVEIQHQYQRYIAAITLVKSLGGGYTTPCLPLEPQ